MNLQYMDRSTLLQAATLLEAENRKLLSQVLQLKQQVRQLQGQEPEQLAMEVMQLEQQLAMRNRLLFGDKSEKRPRASKHEDTQTPEQKGHGPRPQPSLPVLETVHRLEQADQVCLSCGGQLTEWQGQSEESEQIESIQRCFVLVKHKRLKYRCECGGCVETALGPNKLIAGGRYAPSVAIGVAVDKYADHLPLERQARIMTRQGLTMDSQTLWDQIDALAHHLQPAYERLHQYVLTHPVLGADETPWKLLGHRGKVSSRCYAWALCAPDAVLYRIDGSRSAEAAGKILRDFSGTLLCDGYTAYESRRKQGASFRIAHCWAHVRRKFIEAEPTAPKECSHVLDLIGQLYALEHEVRDGPPEARLAARQTKSRHIVQAIHRWALQVQALPQSALGKAIGYMGSLWPGLQVFLWSGPKKVYAV
jgi:transposase